MSKPKKLPDDVRQTCIQLIRGYDRRVRDYYDRRREIIEGSPSRYQVIKDKDDPDNWRKTTYAYAPSSHSASRSGEDKAMQLLGLEELPETKRMRAVEQAKLQIGLDLPEDTRRKLVDAMILNCKAGRRYPFECLGLESKGIGRSNFYDRRMEFLVEIAKNMDLV